MVLAAKGRFLGQPIGRLSVIPAVSVFKQLAVQLPRLIKIAVFLNTRIGARIFSGP
jgi:hypothetical protein